jgi:hypothetical protein
MPTNGFRVSHGQFLSIAAIYALEYTGWRHECSKGNTFLKWVQQTGSPASKDLFEKLGAFGENVSFETLNAVFPAMEEVTKEFHIAHPEFAGKEYPVVRPLTGTKTFTKDEYDMAIDVLAAQVKMMSEGDETVAHVRQNIVERLLGLGEEFYDYTSSLAEKMHEGEPLFHTAIAFELAFGEAMGNPSKEVWDNLLALKGEAMQNWEKAKEG